jgi:methionyl-tRNA formyltransferase
MKVIFFGTPQIAVPSLEYLVRQADVVVLAVVTQPDKPVGRGQKLCSTPVCSVARGHDIPVYQPESIRKDVELIKTLKELEPDFFVTFAFGQILSQEVLAIPKYGCVNLHASLLPKYRGANPIQAPILNGDKKTGITTMLTELRLDAGPIVMQREIEITENMTAPELAEIISKTSPELVYRSLKGLYDGTITPSAQNEEEVTFAPKVKKEDGNVDWSQSPEKIHNMVRGLKPWPQTVTSFRGVCLKISETRLCADDGIKGKPGEILGKADNGVKVAAGGGSIIVTRIQPACKGEQDAAAWYNGARIQKGDGFDPVISPENPPYECS